MERPGRRAERGQAADRAGDHTGLRHPHRPAGRRAPGGHPAPVGEPEVRRYQAPRRRLHRDRHVALRRALRRQEGRRPAPDAASRVGSGRCRCRLGEGHEHDHRERPDHAPTQAADDHLQAADRDNAWRLSHRLRQGHDRGERSGLGGNGCHRGLHRPAHHAAEHRGAAGDDARRPQHRPATAAQGALRRADLRVGSYVIIDRPAGHGTPTAVACVSTWTGPGTARARASSWRSSFRPRPTPATRPSSSPTTSRSGATTRYWLPNLTNPTKTARPAPADFSLATLSRPAAPITLVEMQGKVVDIAPHDVRVRRVPEALVLRHRLEQRARPTSRSYASRSPATRPARCPTRTCRRSSWPSSSSSLRTATRPSRSPTRAA